MNDASVPSVFASRALRVLAVLVVPASALFAVDLRLGAVVPAWAEWVLITVSHMLALDVCRRVAAASELSPAARRFWRTAVLGLSVMLVSLLLRLLDSVSGLPTEGPAQIIHGLGALTLLYGLLRLPMSARTRQARLALGLDYAITIASGAVFFWHDAALQTLHAHGGSPATLATIVMMMAVALLGMFMAVKVVLAGTETLTRSSLQLVGLACLVGGVGSSLNAEFAGRANVFLVVIPAAGLLIALGARRQLRGVAAEGAVRKPRRRWSVVPYLAVAAVSGLLIRTVAADAEDRMIVAVSAVLLTGLVTFRQLSAFRENSTLLDRLDASLLDLQREKDRFRHLVQNAIDIVAITEDDGTIRYISPALGRILDRHSEDLTGRQVHGIIHPDDWPVLRDAVVAIRDNPGGQATYQARFAHSDGSWRWLETILTNLTDVPSIGGYVSNSSDITETRAVQEQLSHDATHDALTGLANRVLFGQRVAEHLAGGDPFSVVLVDLDDFKTVNDTLGHAAGDALLVALAGRMAASVRSGDTVARLGGDEFAILFDGLGRDDVHATLTRLVGLLSEPVDVEGHFLAVRASFGVVEGHGGDDAVDLVRRADIAMYEAKARGDGGVEQYRPGMEARGAIRNRLESELRAALACDEFVLHYQPVVTLPGGRITGVEALIRWQHPVRGLLGPDQFVPVAEEGGLIVPIGRWALREACEQAVRWRAAYGPDAFATMAVNVSARQLREPGFAADVAAALAASGLPATALVVEITESTAVGGGATDATLNDLRASGVRLSLDDFGTGASTLSLLTSCPVDEIKLDRSFVPGPEAIAHAVIQLAGALGVDTVAEGVETAEQAGRLTALGYRRAQGYHFARPMPAADVTAWVERSVAVAY